MVCLVSKVTTVLCVYESFIFTWYEIPFCQITIYIIQSNCNFDNLFTISYIYQKFEFINFEILLSTINKMFKSNEILFDNFHLFETTNNIFFYLGWFETNADCLQITKVENACIQEYSCARLIFLLNIMLYSI